MERERAACLRERLIQPKRKGAMGRSCGASKGVIARVEERVYRSWCGITSPPTFSGSADANRVGSEESIVQGR